MRIFLYSLEVIHSKCSQETAWL